MRKSKKCSMVNREKVINTWYKMMVFMNFKSISMYAYFLTLVFTSYCIVADEAFSFDSFDLLSSVEQQDPDSNKSMDVDDFDRMVNDISAQDMSQIRACATGEANNFLTIIDLFKVTPILNEPFYKKTSIPRSRNLINYPCWQLCTYQPISGRQFTTHLFYNQTNKKQFRASDDWIDGTRVGSYLNIENRTLLTVLDEIFESPFFPDNLRNIAKNIDSRKITRTFGNARLEERRLGIIGHFIQEFSNESYFEAKLPILWMIRNLNFTQDEKDFLDKELSILQGGDFDEDAFAKNHIIFDALGAGTLELCWSKKVWEGCNWSVDLGAGVLLPTDGAFKRGLHGTYFDPKSYTCPLQFCDILTFSPSPGVTPNGIDLLEQYFLRALDQFSSIVLQCPLGYNKHLAFELKMSPFWEIRPDLQFNGSYVLELLLPHEESKFFVPIDSGLFSEQYAAMPQTTEAEQQAKLAFLEQRITTLFFPRVINTKIFPGVIFTSVSSLQKSFRNWNFTAGYSGWYQSEEKILSMDKCKDTCTNTPFDSSKAINTDSYSIKLFGKVHRIFHTRRHDDISFSFWADGTVFNKGVGNDFTIGISFDSKF